MPSSSEARNGPVMRRRAADRDDDQEVDHELEREDRIEAEDLGAQRAAEAGQPAAEREGEGEHLRHVDAEAARDARVVDRGAQAAAEARLAPARIAARSVSRPQITMISSR